MSPPVSGLEQWQQFSGSDRETTPHILSPALKQQHEILRDLLQRSVWLAEKCADHEATQILRTRLTNLQAAALLVIVGEVKVGKSSFINALVREDVCEVAPGPCTTGIQELVYGVERDVVSLGHAWERVFLPRDVLREISIVDTPGTNSIVQNHQAITEGYIPQSDLVVFVFSAANPHTHSAWELLTLIRKEWHQKMVFVLQQADRASDTELTINRAHVKEYARERHVEDPAIFTLSAKQEMEGKPESGFAEFRSFLRSGIERGEVWRVKVEQSYQTIRSIMTRVLNHLRAEKVALAEERAFYQSLLHKVEAREARAKSLRLLLVDKLSATYDRLARHSEDEFTEGLRVGKILRRAIPFRREKNHETWIDDVKTGFQETARKEIGLEAPRVSKDLFEEMQSMMAELTESIARRQEGSHQNGSLPKTGGGDRQELLAQLKSKLECQRVGEIVSAKVADTSDVRKFTLAGSALAALGLAIAALANTPWLSFIGGVFALLGALLVAAGLFWRRSDILREVRRKLGASRKEFRLRLDSEIGQIFDGLLDDIRYDLTETIFRLDLQASQIEPLLEETFRIGEAASEMILRSQRRPPVAATVLRPAQPQPQMNGDR